MPCMELSRCSESDECKNTEDSVNISGLGGIAMIVKMNDTHADIFDTLLLF